VSEKKLTAKQAKFVAVYAGNGTEAARLAGYKGNPNTLHQVAIENLQKPAVLQALKGRQEAEVRPLIATRQDRQRFWTEVLMSPETEMRDRLKASELLGKSEADFTDKVEHSGALTLEQLVTASMAKPGTAE
jgi:phage terminase small subunit